MDEERCNLYHNFNKFSSFCLQITHFKLKFLINVFKFLDEVDVIYMVKFLFAFGIFAYLAPVWAQQQNQPQPADEQAPEQQQSSESQPATPGATMYVVDKIVITLRAGPSAQHKILKHLSTGAKLETFESNDKFVRVKTSGGLEGWVLNQYLTDKPLAKNQIDQANNQIAELSKKNQALEEQIKQLQQSYAKLKDQNRRLDNNKAQMEQELKEMRSVAEQPLRLSNENKSLAKRAASLETQLETLQEKVTVLSDDSQKQWFISGAGVVFLGIVIGLLLPKFRRYRRSDWSTLK